MKKVMVFSFVLTGILLSGVHAKADDLSIVISPQTQSVAPGSTTPLLFYATVTDTDSLGSTPLNLNGDAINIVSEPAALPGDDFEDDTGFWLNFNETIDPQTSISDQLLLAVTISDPATALGLYEQTFQILDDNGDVLGTADFAFDVTSATPEPSSFLLLGTGLLAVWFLARRRLLA